MSSRGLLFPLIMQRCKLHQGLADYLHNSVSILISNKHDPNLPYKYFRSEQRDPAARGAWQRWQGAAGAAERGGKCFLPRASRRTAILGTAWRGQGPQPSLRRASGGSGRTLTLSLERHPVTNKGPACTDPKVVLAEAPPRPGCAEGTGPCQVSLHFGLDLHESLRKH